MNKLKNAMRRYGPAVAGIATGALVTYIITKKADVWYATRCTPEQLQLLIENPESVVLFKEAHTMVGNTTSSEVL